MAYCMTNNNEVIAEVKKNWSENGVKNMLSTMKMFAPIDRRAIISYKRFFVSS